MKPLNRDLLTHASARGVANTSMALLTAIQDRPKEQQLLGLAGVFLALSKHWGIGPQDCFNIVDNIINDPHREHTEFKSVESYINEELS